MKFTIVASVFLSFFLTIHGEVTKESSSVVRRGLQVLNEACDNLIASLFDGLGSNCACEPNLRPPTVKVACDTPESVCVIPGSELLCGFPSFEFAVDFMRLLEGKIPVAATVCYESPTIAGNPVPEIIPFCIESGDGILGLITGGLSGESVDNSTSAAVGETCTARFGDTDCTSCTVCDLSGGVVFNCSNVIPSFESTSCAPLPTGF